jgi:hypothetical protein
MNYVWAITHKWSDGMVSDFPRIHASVEGVYAYMDTFHKHMLIHPHSAARDEHNETTMIHCMYESPTMSGFEMGTCHVYGTRVVLRD